MKTKNRRKGGKFDGILSSWWKNPKYEQKHGKYSFEVGKSVNYPSLSRGSFLACITINARIVLRVSDRFWEGSNGQFWRLFVPIWHLWSKQLRRHHAYGHSAATDTDEMGWPWQHGHARSGVTWPRLGESAARICLWNLSVVWCDSTRKIEVISQKFTIMIYFKLILLINWIAFVLLLSMMGMSSVAWASFFLSSRLAIRTQDWSLQFQSLWLSDSDCHSESAEFNQFNVIEYESSRFSILISHLTQSWQSCKSPEAYTLGQVGVSLFVFTQCEQRKRHENVCLSYIYNYNLMLHTSAFIMHIITGILISKMY